MPCSPFSCKSMVGFCRKMTVLRDCYMIGMFHIVLEEIPRDL